ncbi:hypothetical protein BD779DRAFT_1484423 [Infundibulicybe gibba]|nr:hypothetical protein BD779DRAFT_1484423 [Infundibulicybe gibba]
MPSGHYLGLENAWSDSDEDVPIVDVNLEYLRAHPSAALPPSPLSPSSYGRPPWSPTPHSQFLPPISASSGSSSDSQLSSLSPLMSAPASSNPPFSLRPEPNFTSSVEPIPSNSFARPPKSTTPLPDPAQFPDPYPFRPPHHHLTSAPAAPSSAGSSSASARSSAYTSSGSALASGDYGHVHVASGEDDTVGSVGITSDAVLQLLANDANLSSSAHGMQSKIPTDQARWSESYSASIRSRSSSLCNTNGSNTTESPVPKLQQKPSYDMGWQTVDERDEVGMSEEETDDDHVLGEEEEEREEERTSAVVIAEEGRGLIVHGDNVPIVQLQVQTGTTHLLIGSSSTPNAMPSFLTTTLPQICTTLLALDISANFLGALPPILAVCINLEELNIASNPLRVLPVFLADLTGLRVLIADSTGISTLPDTLVDLDKLHTISVRRNKMHALPSWLCLLPALQVLCVDGNPFQGPWKALVEPLLTKAPMTPAYPPSTPISSAGAETDTDVDDSDSESPNFTSNEYLQASPEDEEDHTITSARVPHLGRLTRTRTTPNRAYFDQTRAKNNNIPSSDLPNTRNPQATKQEDVGYFGDHELRKMKSAGDLRRGKSAAAVVEPSVPTPSRPTLANYTSQSSSNLLNTTPAVPERPSLNKRPALTQSLWDNISENEEDPSKFPRSNRTSFAQGNQSPPSKVSSPNGAADRHSIHQRNSKDGKEKGSRWGFLKKMSMGKMKVDSPPPLPSSHRRPTPTSRPHTSAGAGSGPSGSSKSPQIDIRFSTTGTLGAITTPGHSLDNHKSAKRRSFLPIESAPLSLNIPIPDTSAFVPGITATSDADEVDTRYDNNAYIRREEERARETYMRALRSVMAYLRDMNDLGSSQQSNPLSMYGAVAEDTSGLRSRRPTVVDGAREVSMALSGTTIAASESNGQLRSMESIAGLRSGSAALTMSVATTDSSGSSEERKFKDDKGKRAMVVREIVATERTYVKGLQELVDIYIKPSCVPVNLLSGVGTSKDTLLPASERRVVFGGIDALFSFHKESFLPALEIAAAPIMRPSSELQEADADGQLSLSVAKAVGNMFLKHAAFMRMYSSYINNFDQSVQRVKYWSADRHVAGSTSPASTLSPSGLGLSMSAISSPGVTSEGGPSATGVPNLSSGQRRRIKSYLKRCRMNPRHSQLNLEGYLLLPVQRIPRYRLLLEELLRSTPPTYEYMDDPLDRALGEISSLANNMNEGKRESESRRKLVQWQGRIRGKFPSPLVQPHRRLIMDGPLLLTRVVRKAMVSFEAINAQGDASTVQLTPRPLIGILCNDLLVLCRDSSEGQDPSSYVDLWAVLRMQTLPQPASIVHGNALRLVDNKAILYFDAPSPSDALNWYRAINLHIPASKT